MVRGLLFILQQCSSKSANFIAERMPFHGDRQAVGSEHRWTDEVGKGEH